MSLGHIKNIVFRIIPNQYLIKSGSPKSNTIYLTFDDGPHQGYTEELLNILDKSDIKASFFVTGDHVKKYKSILNMIISKGHDVYNHAYSHWEFDSLTTSEQIQDLDRLDALLPETSSQSSLRPFRPPRGRITLSLLLRLIISRRKIIYWNVDSKDYLQLGKDHILEQFRLNTVKAGDIILFHDDNSFTIDALPDLIDGWKRDGFAIEPISSLVGS